MIPKIIHYCWLSNDPIPKNMLRYMNSWREILHDYEFIKWDFTRFDKFSSKWVQQAFDAKKYAFAADYIRLYALYNYGGIYLDMDVKILKSFTPFLGLHTMMGYENSAYGKIEAAVIGVEKGSPWVKACLDYYNNRVFVRSDGSMDTKVLPYVIRDNLLESGFQLVNVDSIEKAYTVEENKIPVFPFDFFSPKSYDTGEIEDTGNTVTIHNFAGSWVPTDKKIHLYFWRLLPSFVRSIIKRGKNG